MRSQLRMTGLCCGLFIKQKQLKKPTEECCKEQFLPSPLPFFQSPLIIIIVKNNISCPFPLSLASRRALPDRVCAGSYWKAATAREGEQRHSPRHPWRNWSSPVWGNSWVTILLRGRQQPRGWKCSGPQRAIHQPSPIVPEHVLCLSPSR